MVLRQPAYNRRVAPGATRTHFWLFYAILEVGPWELARRRHCTTALHPGQPQAALDSPSVLGGLTVGAGYPAAPFRPSHGLPTESARMERCPFNGHGPSWLRSDLHLIFV